MQLFDRTLGQWLEHWAEETPDKEYIVYSDRNLRFTPLGWNVVPMWVSGRLMFPIG